METIERDPSRGLNAAVAATLNGERSAAGKSFQDLADMIGVSKRTMLRQLSTKERHIGTNELDAMAAAFGLTADQVIAMARERMNRPPTPTDNAESA